MSANFKGDRYEPFVSKDGKTYFRRTEEWEAFRNKKYCNHALKESNLSFLSPDFTFDTYSGEDKNKNIPKLKKYASKFKTKYRRNSLYLYGDTATQKSITAGLVGQELLKQGVTVYYINMTELQNLILSSIFTREQEYVDKVKKISRKDFLIIDRSFLFDMNKKFMNEMDAFLRQRLEVDKLATCFISQIAIDKMEDSRFPRNIASLLRRNCFSMFFEDIVNEFNIDDLFSD